MFFADHQTSLQTPSFQDENRVADGVYTEVHFSAEDLARRLTELLEFLGLDWKTFTAYLRENRDA